MSDIIENYLSGATSSYTIMQPLHKEQENLDLISRIHGTTTTVGFFSSKTTSAEIPAIRINENLSEEDIEAREKGFLLVAQMERLAQKNEEFHRWLQIGLKQIEAGEFVTFSEDGWKEE